MTRIARLADALGIRGVGVERASRIIAVQVTFDTNLEPRFLVSEPVANNVVVKHVWCDATWLAHGVHTLVGYDISTGFGRNVSFAQVVNWQRIIPVRWSGGQGQILVTESETHHDWSMRLPLSGDGRRFGVSGRLVGAGECILLVSFEIEEG